MYEENYPTAGFGFDSFEVPDYKPESFSVEKLDNGFLVNYYFAKEGKGRHHRVYCADVVEVADAIQDVVDA